MLAVIQLAIMLGENCTSLELFAKKVEGLTDLSEYLLILAQNGIPALQSAQTANERPEDTERRWVCLIGISSAGVLRRRQEAGLSNNPHLLLSMLREWDSYFFQEFVVDPIIKDRICKGVCLGLGIAGVIPPSEIIQPTPRETVASYFGLN